MSEDKINFFYEYRGSNLMIFWKIVRLYSFNRPNIRWYAQPKLNYYVFHGRVTLFFANNF